MLRCFNLLLILLLLNGCVTERKRLQICKSCTLSQSVTDSVSVQIQEKEVKVYVHDTIIYNIENPCAELCDSLGNLKEFHKEITSDKGAQMTLYTKNNHLYVQDDLNGMETTAEITDTTTTHHKTIIKEVPARCDLEHISGWDNYFIAMGRMFCVILLILLLGAIFKNFIK